MTHNHFYLMLKEINRYFNQISQTDISISRVYNVRFLECHSVLKVARRWTVREARLSPGACSTQTYMYTCTYVCMLIYINICRVSLQMVLVEYVVYWLAVVATVGGGAFVAATQRYFQKLCGNFHLLLQFWNLYLI